MIPWGLLFQLIPAALGAIPKVEALFGKTQDADHGATKLSSSMDIIKSLVPELEDIFQVSPQWRGVIEAGISLVYEALKVSGKLPALTAAATVQLQAQNVAVQAQPVAAGS